jgi:uncharacterized coiled-coil protein SlyX
MEKEVVLGIISAAVGSGATVLISLTMGYFKKQHDQGHNTAQIDGLSRELAEVKKDVHELRELLATSRETMAEMNAKLSLLTKYIKV